MKNKYLISKLNEDCCGCGACELKCPKQCIELVENNEGFLYPSLNRNKCIDCGICKNVCPMEIERKDDKMLPYAAYSKNKNILRQSSSGGIFSEFSEYILENQGKVYGAYMDKKFNVTHIGIETSDDLYKLTSSKYVQSDINNTYLTCKEDLDNKRLVFYVGTPCQIYGLKKFLGKEYENLYTADLICHGVPSKKMFYSYIDYLEKKHKGILTDINFRDKEKNKWSITLSYKILKNGKEKKYNKISSLSEYFNGFLSGSFMRDSCYKCPFSATKRYGDVTLGDFWGYQKSLPSLRNDDGLSIVLCNTNRGRNMIELLKRRNVFLTQVSEESVLKSENKNLFYPTRRPEIRNNIYIELDRDGFDSISNKYFRDNFTLKNRIKNLIPLQFIKYIKGGF